MQPFGIYTIKVIVLGFFTYLITLLIPKFDDNVLSILFNILVKSIIILIIFGGGIIYLKVSDDVNYLVISLTKKVLGKYKS
jgi:hypothetical protein